MLAIDRPDTFRLSGFPGMLVVLIATGLCYLRVYQFEFLNWDDVSYVVERQEIHGGLSWNSIAWAFVTFQNANYHPLTWLSYIMETELFGLSSAVMHLTNLVIHLVNTFLVVLLIRRWTANPMLPLGVGLFFGIHPQHVEVVAWVSERKELLAVFFGLLTMLVWDEYRKSGRWSLWWLAHGCFLLSLLSKQMLVTLPFLFVVLDVCPLRDGDREIAWRSIPASFWRNRWMFLLTILFSAGIFLAQRSGGAVLALSHLPLGYRLANAVQSVVLYLLQTAVPLNLNPFYRHPFLNISIPLTLLCGALLIVAGGFVWSRRRQPGVLAGALWFVGTLVPVIGFVQLGSAARADRYMYFPHIGLFLLAGRLVMSCSPSVSRWLTCAAACSAIVLVPVTYLHANHWASSIALWEHCLRIDPLNFRGRELLALEFLARERVDEALREAELSIQLPENQYAGGTNTILGCALLIKGETDRAIVHLKRGIEIEPQDYRALINLGYALRETDLPEAKRLFEEALKHSPNNIEAMANLANCEAQFGNLDKAVLHLKKACRLDPKNTRLKENLKLFESALSESRR